MKGVELTVRTNVGQVAMESNIVYLYNEYNFYTSPVVWQAPWENIQLNVVVKVMFWKWLVLIWVQQLAVVIYVCEEKEHGERPEWM